MNMMTEKSNRRFHRLWLCLAMLCVCVGVFAMPQTAHAAPDRQNWMKDLPDTMQISQINLPGTHDSGCCYMRSIVKKGAKTQDWYFETQLNNGIRNFDIRLGPYGSDDNIYDMKLCHGDVGGVTMNCYTGSGCTERLVLDDVLGYCEKFVTAHPTETIVLMLREEIGGDDINEKIGAIVEQLHHQNGTGNEKYPNTIAYKSGERVPKLGEVRGKIVILCKKKKINGSWDTRLAYTDFETDYEWIDGKKDYVNAKEKKQRIEFLIALSKGHSNYQEYYPKNGQDDTFHDTQERLKKIMYDDVPSGTVRAPMLVSTNLTGMDGSHITGDGPRTCWNYLYENKSGDQYAHFDKVNLDQRYMRLGWWQFDFPPQYHVDQLINSNLGKTLVKYYVHVENTEAVRRASVESRLLAANPYLDDDLSNPYRLCRAEGKGWRLDADQKFYVQEYESFVSDQSIYFTELFIAGSTLRPVKLTRKTDKSDPKVIRIDDYFTFESPDTPNEMEIRVEWNKNILDAEIPQTMDAFKNKLFKEIVFTAFNQRIQKRSITSADFRDYRYVSDTRTSIFKVVVPTQDKEGYLLNYAKLDMPEALKDYRFSYTSEPDYKQFTIQVRAALGDGYTQVPVNIEWYDGNDRYGTRYAAMEYLKTEFVFHNRYEARDMSKILYNWKLVNIELQDKASKAIFTLKDFDDDAQQEAYAHFVQFEEKSQKHLLTDLHYQVNQDGIFKYAPHMKNPKYEEHRLITIENLYLMGTLNVKVTWVDDDASGRPEEGVSASLSGVEGGFLDIASSSGNVWVKNNVPCRAFNSNNEEITFDSSFLALPGTYTPVRDYNVQVVADKSTTPGELPVYNVEYIMTKKASVPVAGTMTWHDGGYSFTHRKPNLRVIQQYLIDPSLGAVDGNVVEVEIPSDELQIAWKGNQYSFADNTCFPKYKSNGSPCTYLIEADQLQDYDIRVDGWNLTATRLISVYGNADWEDPTHRPMSIQPVVQVIQNDQMIGSPVTAERYAYAVKNLPISDENDQLYQYEIYTYLPGLENDERIYCTYTEPEQNETNGNVRIDAAFYMKTAQEAAKVPVKLTLKNTDPATEPELFSFTIEGETSKGLFSDFMMLNKENGFTDSFELSADLFEDNRTYSFKVQQWNVGKLDWDQDTHVEEVTISIRYINGVRVPQVDMGGKTVLEFINSRLKDTEYITAMGFWLDGGIEGIYHPDRVPIHLLADGVEVRSAELTAEHDYWFTFTKLPIHRDDQEKTAIVYTLQADAPDGYVATVRGDASTGFLVNYALQITVSGSVDWEDSKRPANNQPMVQLLRNGQMVGNPVEETDFTYCFEGQPIADETNDPYDYSIVASLEGFDASISYLPIEKNPLTGDVIADAVIRKLDVEQKIEVPVQLTLVNSDPATEPESFFFLMEGENKDGTYQGILTLSSDNSFAGSFVLDGSLFENDKSYTYTVKQIFGNKINWNYDDHIANVIIKIVYINGVRTAQVDLDGDAMVRFTNTRLNDTKEVTVTAKWVNGDRQNCPARTAIQLYGDGALVQQADLTQIGSWTYTFSDLPLYRSSLPRTPVEYTISYDVPEGYSAVLSGDSSSGFVVTYTALVSVSGSVDWADGKRPANNQPKVQLLRNGQMIGQPVVEQDFKYAFTGLPIADAQNVQYTYSIAATLEGFDVSITNQPITRDAYGNVTANAVIRKLNAEQKVEVPVKLTLKNSDPATEPETFFFLMEGENKDGTYQGILALDSDNSFESTFVLDGSLLEDDKSYFFTVKQILGDKANWNYDSHVAAVSIKIVYLNGVRSAQVDIGGDTAVCFTNTRLNDTEQITVTAKWINGDRQNCPARTAIQLYGDGVLVQQADLTQTGSWTYTFSDLPLYRSSLPRTPVEYSISYDVPEGYSAVLSGDSSSGFVVTYTALVSVSGSVDWADGKRPANNQPKVQLLRNGQMIGQPVEEQDFKYAFTDLPIADAQNVPYAYSIAATLEGFDVSITNQPVTRDAYGNVTANAVITKMGTPIRAEVPVKLILKGVDASAVSENFYFIIERPDVNGSFRTLVQLSRENNFTDFFVIDATSFESDKPYSFTVRQLKGDKQYWTYDERIANITITIVYINGKAVAQVSTDEKGLTFRNVYCAVPCSISIELNKQIVNLLEGIAVPDKQTFQFELLQSQANGNTSRLSTVSLTGEGHAQFPSIKLTDAGTFTYLVREYSEDTPGWTFDHTNYPVIITVSDTNGQLHATADSIPTITNTYETTMMNVGVKAQWVDNNKKKKPIPDHVEINLFADGRSVGQARLTQGSNWRTCFAELPEYRRANAERTVQMVPIEYTLTTETVNGFTVNIAGDAKSGYVVTYTAIRDLPVTGDQMNLPLIGGMLLVSMGALLALVHKRKKN